MVIGTYSLTAAVRARVTAGEQRGDNDPTGASPHSLPPRREELVRHLARRQRPVEQVDMPDRARSD